MSRPNGTYLLPEREVYVEDSYENKVWDFCLTGALRSGWLFAAARSCSRIEGFSRAAS